jgi:outer membrane protein assembly factor BamA
VSLHRLLISLAIILCATTLTVFAQVGDYEGRPVSAVEVVLEGSPPDPSAQAEFQSLLKIVSGGEYTAVNARQSLHDLFASGRVAAGRVEIVEGQPAGRRNTPVRVRFIVQRQIVIAGVTLRIGPTTGTPVARDEIRARLNLLEPGRRFSLQAIERNADEIQVYLRDRGYYNATVEHTEEPDPSDTTGTRRRVVYTITTGAQARIGQFVVDIPGFDPNTVKTALKLQPGAPFTRDILGEDITGIKQALIAKSYLSPQLGDPEVKFDSAKNEINIKLSGKLGPKRAVAALKISFRNRAISFRKLHRSALLLLQPRAPWKMAAKKPAGI